MILTVLGKQQCLFELILHVTENKIGQICMINYVLSSAEHK